MEYISVLAAAIAAFAYGAAHYMVLAKPWMAASGVKVGEDGRPVMENNRVSPFLLAAISMVLVAGMMRHVLAMSGIEELGKAILTGVGIGAFFIAPWTMLNNGYSDRPFMLTIIDGAYAIIGCGIMGAVLALL